MTDVVDIVVFDLDLKKNLIILCTASIFITPRFLSKFLFKKVRHIYKYQRYITFADLDQLVLTDQEPNNTVRQPASLAQVVEWLLP